MGAKERSTCELDLSGRRLMRDGKQIPLSGKAFELLRLFVENPDRLLSKETILREVWPDTFVTEGSIKDYVKDIRKALGDPTTGAPRFVETVRGHGYRYLGGIAVREPDGPILPPASRRGAVPALAVLPFAFARRDRAAETLAANLADDIRTELSHFYSLDVIASAGSIDLERKSCSTRSIGRLLGAPYLLGGSVRFAGAGVRITAKLIEAGTGRYLWAESFDRDAKIPIRACDEIARTVAATVAARLKIQTRNRAAYKLTEAMGAYDHVLLGESIVASTPENNERARQAYLRALDLNPACATAMAGLAHSHAIDGLFGYASYEESLDRALSVASTGVAADPTNSKAEWVLGHVLDLRKEREHAEPYFDRALELNPLDADAYVMKAMFLKDTGRAEQAVASIATAMRLNPYYPAWYSWNLGNAFYHSGQYAKSLEPVRAATDRSPGHMRPRRCLAAAYAQLDRIDEAQGVINEILLHEPDASLAYEAKLVSKWQDDAQIVDYWLEGLRKAGLPE